MSMSTRDNREIKKSENQSKFIQERISQVEKHFGDLCSEFAGLGRKLSKLRDRGDGVAKCVMAYADHEDFNQTTKEALTTFAEDFSLIQDYREAEVKRIEAKVVDPLTMYGTACKHAKNDLKKAFEARGKEAKQTKKLENVIDKNPSDRHTISQAETELQKAAVDASWSSKALEERMDEFEQKKLQDLKKVLTEFVNVEILFHVKALETYTKCYHDLEKINTEEDLELFRNSLRPNQTQNRLEMQRASSMRSLNNTTSSRTPPQPRRHSDTPAPNLPPQARGMYSQHAMDDDSDEEDDYEDDSEEDEYEPQYNNHPGNQPPVARGNQSYSGRGNPPPYKSNAPPARHTPQPQSRRK